MERRISREDILSGRFSYPKNLISLRKTNHFIQRMRDRSFDLDVMPSVIRATPSNIYSGKVNRNNSITSMVLRINYTISKWMFLCINPNTGAILTFWFKEKKNGNRICRQKAEKDSRQTI